MSRINIFVIIRILIGLLFIVSGSEKIIGPYQNFLYVVQSYELLNPALEEVTAHVFPWIELLLGVFLLLGLWSRWAIRGLMGLVVIFLIVVGQALYRGLPISECGCFGEMLNFPLHVMLMIDGTLFLLLTLLLRKIGQANQVSLDNCFNE